MNEIKGVRLENDEFFCVKCDEELEPQFGVSQDIFMPEYIELDEVYQCPKCECMFSIISKREIGNVTEFKVENKT